MEHENSKFVDFSITESLVVFFTSFRKRFTDQTGLFVDVMEAD